MAGWGSQGEGFPAQLGWRECVDCGGENSEKDLKGADVTLVTFFFFKLGFQKQARGNYKWPCQENRALRRAVG